MAFATQIGIEGQLEAFGVVHHVKSNECTKLLYTHLTIKYTMNTTRFLFICIFIFSFNSIQSQQITLKYDSKNNDAISFTYLYSEHGKSISVLSLNNAIINIKTPKSQFIQCVDINRRTVIFAKPNEIINLNINKKGLIDYSCETNSIRKYESEFINECFVKYGSLEPNFIRKLRNESKSKSASFDDNYSNEKKMLNEYFSKKLISKEFYSQFNLLLWCLTVENKIHNQQNQNDGFKVLEKSFSSTGDLLNIAEYRRVLTAYSYIKMKMAGFRTDNIYSYLNFVRINFKNQDIIDYLLYNSIKNNVLLSHQKINNNTLNLFYTNCKNKEFIDEIKKDFDQKVNSIYLKRIIKESGCKLAVIDFWASWCKPCLEELPYAKRMINSYPQVKYIFVSIDKSKTDWLKSTKMKSDIFNSTNSFLLSEIKDENILSKLNITTIPRFILLDQNGQILDANLLHPSDAKFISVIERYLNEMN